MEKTASRTDTAHLKWDETWQTEEGRARWLDPEPSVLRRVPELKKRKAHRVLDLGCGVGRHALTLAAEGFDVRAIDGSASGIEFLQKAAEEQGLAVDCSVGSMSDLPFPSGSLDYVLAWNVIYHGDLPVVCATIAEILRVLRPGGVFQGTMLSKRNEHYGQGRRVACDTFVLAEISDKAHPHYYCNASDLVGLFTGMELLSLEDVALRQEKSWHWIFFAEKQ